MKKFLKENVVPILIISVVSLLLVYAMLPLSQAEWADVVRTAFQDKIAEEKGTQLGILIYIVPFVKLTIWMGTGVLLTILVRKLINLFSHLVSSKKM